MENSRREINAKAVGKKVYVLTDWGGWYGTIKDAYEDSFLVVNQKGTKESLVDIFNIRWPEDPILE